jgi:hypothetical protein
MARIYRFVIVYFLISSNFSVPSTSGLKRPRTKATKYRLSDSDESDASVDSDDDDDASDDEFYSSASKKKRQRQNQVTITIQLISTT